MGTKCSRFPIFELLAPLQYGKWANTDFSELYSVSSVADILLCSWAIESRTWGLNRRKAGNELLCLLIACVVRYIFYYFTWNTLYTILTHTGTGNELLGEKLRSCRHDLGSPLPASLHRFTLMSCN